MEPEAIALLEEHKAARLLLAAWSSVPDDLRRVDTAHARGDLLDAWANLAGVHPGQAMRFGQMLFDLGAVDLESGAIAPDAASFVRARAMAPIRRSIPAGRRRHERRSR